MSAVLKDTALSLLVIVVHTTLTEFIAILGITPDIPLAWIVYLSVRRGQIPGTVGGFLIGLTLDLLSGLDGVLGLSALTMTLAGFVAGYFYNENKIWQTLGGTRFLVITAIAASVHHLLYFVIFLQGTAIGWWGTVGRYAVPSVLSTTAAAVLPMLWIRRSHELQL